MDTLDFLQTVCPEEGIYCFAAPFTPKGSKKAIFSHKTFTSIEKLVDHAERVSDTKDCFFSILTLKETQTWNPRKKNFKTGELGAFEVRSHSNMSESRCFFLDIDVGKSTTAKPKYETQAAAAKALKSFTKDTELPRPTIVSSGYGLHVYWALTEALDADTWEGYAKLLRDLVSAYEFHADPSRIIDRSSVLRIPGTINHKRNLSAPVEIVLEGKATKTADFIRLLKAACRNADIEDTATPKKTFDTTMGVEYNGKVPSLDMLTDSCNLMHAVYKHGGDYAYEQWHKSLAVFRCVEDGRAVAHEWSARDYADYDADVVDAKLDDQELQGVGATSCEVLQGIYGDDYCDTCPFLGKVKGPISAALAPKAVEPPTINVQSDEDDEPEEIKLTLPEGYIRTADGRIFQETIKDGKIHHQLVMEYDIYPVTHQVDEANKTDQHTWIAKLPRGKEREIHLPSATIQDGKELAKALSNHSVFIDPSRKEGVQKFMSAYLKSLQKVLDAEHPYNHFGWQKNCESFMIGDKLILGQDKSKTVTINGGAASIMKAHHFGCRGTLEKQIELMKFFDKPHLIKHQYFILGALASVLLFMTNQHGHVLSLFGMDSGCGKSTALMAGMSFWGHPELTSINGVKGKGMTEKARDEFMYTLRNLPVGVDEITTIDEEDAKALAYNISQTTDRGRLNNKGELVVRPIAEGSIKAAIMMITTNRSMHTMLSANSSTGSASSQRVIEMNVPVQPRHLKRAADEFINGILENYGHIGEAFMRFVVEHREVVTQTVRDMVIKVDEKGSLTPAERFLSADIACVLVACKISHDLGLLPFKWKTIRDYAMIELIPKMRGIIAEEYLNPTTFLCGLIDDVLEEAVITSHLPGSTSVDRCPPNGAISARYERSNKTLWVTLDRVKLQAVRKRVDYSHFVQQLMDMKLILDKNVRKTLGAGTDFSGARAYTYVIDMSRPELAEQVEEAVKKAKERDHLKVVK